MKNNSHHLPGMKSFKGKLLQITISNSKEKSFQIKNFFFEIIFFEESGSKWTVQRDESGRSKWTKVERKSGRSSESGWS